MCLLFNCTCEGWCSFRSFIGLEEVGGVDLGTRRQLLSMFSSTDPNLPECAEVEPERLLSPTTDSKVPGAHGMELGQSQGPETSIYLGGHSPSGVSKLIVIGREEAGGCERRDNTRHAVMDINSSSRFTDIPIR